jgi:D-apiose dehydrogenase
MTTPSPSRLRVAIVGCGFASEYHLKAWQRVPGVEILAVCDPVLDRRESRAREFGVPHAFATVADLLAGVTVDAYDIAAPHQVHRVIAEQLVGAGKPVLCQKPLAANLEDARAIVMLFQQRGVRFMVNENWRWRVFFQEIKRQLQSGTIGDPFYARLGIRTPGVVPTPEYPDSFMLPRQPRFRTERQLLILETIVHHVDTMRFLFGEVSSLYLQTRNPSPHTVGETLAIGILNQGPVLSVLDESWVSYGYTELGSAESMVIEGSEGSLFLRENALSIALRSGARKPIPIDATDFYVRMYWGAINHFAECLRTGTPFQTDGLDNLKTLEITLAAYDSAAENKVIHFTAAHDSSNRARMPSRADIA